MENKSVKGRKSGAIHLNTNPAYDQSETVARAVWHMPEIDMSVDLKFFRDRNYERQQ